MVYSVIKHFIIQLMHNIKYVDTIKSIEYLKVLHVNGHDRIIVVIFSQALYNSPWWWILCDLKHVGALLNIL